MAYHFSYIQKDNNENGGENKAKHTAQRSDVTDGKHGCNHKVIG